MLYVLVVIHNRTCADSIACRSLMSQTSLDFRVLVYDNSDTDLGIKDECAANGWTYLGGTGNHGLPAAYNCALDHLKAENAAGFICIMDDDTEPGNTFCSDIKAEAEKNAADILLPVMMNKGRILSPWRERGRRFFRSYEECASEPAGNILAFNSGMLIPLDVFSDYRYNEDLFLDCVDISFLRDMKRRGIRTAVVPVYCEQGFSGTERPSREAAMNRFKLYSGDMRTCYGEKDLRCRLVLLKRAAHLAIIYGSLEPFGILLKREKEDR